MKVAIIGGNGYLGSAISKVAINKGLQVTSISQSGQPFRTPSGHLPRWTEKVNWRSGSVFDQKTYRDELKDADAVIHTIGILLESNYKSGPMEIIKGLLSRRFDDGNPLTDGKYELMNRNAAINVSNTFSALKDNNRYPFVYISAADIFRPLIPKKYIDTKYEAENHIQGLHNLRSVNFRPGLMYHPHFRPLSTLPATLIEILNNIPINNLINSQNLDKESNLYSLINLLQTSSLHIDTVAQAVVNSLLNDKIEGPIEVNQIKSIAWNKQI